jgi:hypothetical protein
MANRAEDEGIEEEEADSGEGGARATWEGRSAWLRPPMATLDSGPADCRQQRLALEGRRSGQGDGAKVDEDG